MLLIVCNLCEICLLNNHSTNDCRKMSTQVCGIDGCTEKHTRFIHVAKGSNYTTCDSIDIVAEHTLIQTHLKTDKDNAGISMCTGIHMPIIPVMIVMTTVHS